jgi:hypothetical protein
MTPEPRFCFHYDRPLDPYAADDGDGRLQFCPTCQADREAYQAALGNACVSGPAPRFEGVVAVGVSLPRWPTDIALLALHLWDRFASCSPSRCPDSTNHATPAPFPVPISAHDRFTKWVVTTDVGSTHHGGLGGGGTHGTDKLLAWHSTIAPPLPVDASRLEVLAQAPGATARLTVDLTDRAAPWARATVMRDTTAVGQPTGRHADHPPVARWPTNPAAPLASSLTGPWSRHRNRSRTCSQSLTHDSCAASVRVPARLGRHPPNQGHAQARDRHRSRSRRPVRFAHCHAVARRLAHLVRPDRHGRLVGRLGNGPGLASWRRSPDGDRRPRKGLSRHHHRQPQRPRTLHPEPDLHPCSRPQRHQPHHGVPRLIRQAASVRRSISTRSSPRRAADMGGGVSPSRRRGARNLARP